MLVGSLVYFPAIPSGGRLYSAKSFANIRIVKMGSTSSKGAGVGYDNRGPVEYGDHALCDGYGNTYSYGNSGYGNSYGYGNRGYGNTYGYGNRGYGNTYGYGNRGYGNTYGYGNNNGYDNSIV